MSSLIESGKLIKSFRKGYSVSVKKNFFSTDYLVMFDEDHIVFSCSGIDNANRISDMLNSVSANFYSQGLFAMEERVKPSCVNFINWATSDNCEYRLNVDKLWENSIEKLTTEELYDKYELWRRVEIKKQNEVLNNI